MTGDMVQVIEYLPSKCKVLSSNPSTVRFRIISYLDTMQWPGGKKKLETRPQTKTFLHWFSKMNAWVGRQHQSKHPHNHSQASPSHLSLL
jgi:hypothetical protein